MRAIATGLPSAVASASATRRVASGVRASTAASARSAAIHWCHSLVRHERGPARVSRPGGQVAIGVWGDPGPLPDRGAVRRLRTLAPPPPGTPAPLAVSDPGVVESLLEKAALTVTGGGEAAAGFGYADHEQAWTAHTSAGPLQKVIEIAGPDAVRQVMHDVLEADRKPDGELRQDNIFRYVLAAKE